MAKWGCQGGIRHLTSHYDFWGLLNCSPAHGADNPRYAAKYFPKWKKNLGRELCAFPDFPPMGQIATPSHCVGSSDMHGNGRYRNIVVVWQFRVVVDLRQTT